MPKIQSGKTSAVPLDTDGRKVWFLLQHIESDLVVNECISGKYHKKKLLARLATAEPDLKCYAVWNGKYYTDLFDIDIPVMMERLKEEMGRKKRNGTAAKKQKKKGRTSRKGLNLKWRGGLSALKDNYTSVELQHEILKHWND
jgi:hypothetical protein